MPKLSIIIPIYNSVPYLRRCLDSTLAQDFSDFELIIVDDGSKDGGREMIEEYARKDTRIKTIFHKSNRGAGAARNSGLNAARGEFVGFVDSDDWIEPDMYSSLLARQAETNADIVECNIERHEPEQKIRLELKNMPTQLNLKDGPDEYLLALQKMNLFPGIFNKIIRASLIKNNSIFFIEDRGLEISEDRLFLLALVPYFKSSSAIPDPNYHHNRRPGSITNQKIKNPEKNIILFLEYFLKTKKGGVLTAAEKLIIITHIKFAFLPFLFQSQRPIIEGAAILRRIMKNKSLSNNLKNLIFYRFTPLKDRFLILLLYFHAYYLYSLFFYLYANYKQGPLSKLHRK
jgi:glycosyltransferase involved in cell wall biosynthesis